MSKKFTPYISPDDDLPQITVKAIILGIILSAILAGANAYLGLKVGMTVSASIPAAVISMAILRLFKNSNILENNIVQTAASAGESIAAGAIFTLPALILLRYWLDFPFWETTAICVTGGVLGVLFTIPLRKALVVDSDLQFPEGIATAEVLKAGEKGGEGVKAIAKAALAAALFKLGQTGLKIFTGSVGGSVKAGKSIFGFGADLSVALLAVGYIVGLNIAVLIFAGGAISWIFGIPIFMALSNPADVTAIVGDATGYDAAYAIWGAKIRYLGVGAMVVGGVWALISLARPLVDGIKAGLQAVKNRKTDGNVDILRTERDTPINIVLWSILGLAVPIFFVFHYVIDIDHLGISTGAYWTTILFGVVFSLFAGFLFSSVAGYMAGLVGSSNNPISGVTIATLLAASLLLLAILGSQVDFSVDTSKATTAAAAAIVIGAMVACGAALAGDNLQDLKTGHLVGATPYKQQIMQVVGAVTAGFVIAPVLSLLYNAYGLGGVMPREGMNASEMLTAPQATLMQSVAEGVFSGNLEWTMIIIGGIIAVINIIIDQVLKRRGSSFRAPVLAVAVGIYLPFELSTPIMIGGLIAWFSARKVRSILSERNTDSVKKVEEAGHRGLLFASGLITGEALLGIILAIPFAILESTDALRLLPEGFEWLSTILGVTMSILFMIWLYKVVVNRKQLTGG